MLAVTVRLTADVHACVFVLFCFLSLFFFLCCSSVGLYPNIPSFLFLSVILGEFLCHHEILLYLVTFFFYIYKCLTVDLRKCSQPLHFSLSNLYLYRRPPIRY